MRHWSTISTRAWLDNTGFYACYMGYKGHDKRVTPPRRQMESDVLAWNSAVGQFVLTDFS